MINALTSADGIYNVADIAAHLLTDDRFELIRNKAYGAMDVADLISLTAEVNKLVTKPGSTVEKIQHAASAVLQVLVVVDILDSCGLTDLTKFSMVIGVGFSPLVSGALAATCFMEVVVIVSSGDYSKKNIASLASASTKLAEQILILTVSTNPTTLLILAVTSSSCGLVKVYFGS